MIVLIDNGAVVELHWRYRGTSEWSPAVATGLLGGLKRLPEDMVRVRQFLAQRNIGGPPTGETDHVVLSRLARFILSGQVLVAEYDFRSTWGESGVVVGSRTRDAVRLLWRNGVKGARDVGDALIALHRIKDQKEEMAALRKTFSSPRHAHQLQAEKDSEFFERIEKFIQHGELIALYHWPYARREAVVELSGSDAPPAERAAPGREDEPDPATFGSGHSPADQADTLAAAAQDGTPFCEVCEEEKRGAGETGEPEE